MREIEAIRCDDPSRNQQEVVAVFGHVELICFGVEENSFHFTKEPIGDRTIVSNCFDELVVGEAEKGRCYVHHDDEGWRTGACLAKLFRRTIILENPDNLNLSGALDTGHSTELEVKIHLTATMSTGDETKRVIYVSSRKSDLALYQTREVISMLQEHYPEIRFEIGLQDTVGDSVLDKHLTQLDTVGVFTKSLEDELLAGRSSFAVHSLKDMPTQLPPGLVLAAICKRESPEDAVIIHPKHKSEVEALLQIASRSLLRSIEGGCQISMGVNTTLDDDTIKLTVTLLSRDGKVSITEATRGSRFEAEQLGESLAHELLKNPDARPLLGPAGQKRALTYGYMEAPGDAAAAAAEAANSSPSKKACIRENE
ncbi:hypothetical protein DYB32_002951 [Aphanomyces invadans]|uniref:hydroxymethylbilane synthase n=1 Tax=Aphanomyces invadans TaxID=157072 RepID=A0A418B206_9STRA|nr:hypothetical protein DYB32_002951 [Aphanomyces invadans]